jgi:hypothetical protein
VHPAASKAKFDAEVALLTPDYLRVKRWTLWSATYPELDLTIELERNPSVGGASVAGGSLFDRGGNPAARRFDLQSIGT